MWKIISSASAAIAIIAIVASRGPAAPSVAAHQQPGAVQDKCEFRANVAFREWFALRKAEAEFWGEDVENLTADYHGYYSDRLQRCLLLVEESASSKRGLERVSFVVDITEQREYAYYLADNNELVICELKPAINREIFCKNRDEFNVFVAARMDE